MWTACKGASLILEKLFFRFSFNDAACFSIFASGQHLDATIISENVLKIQVLMLLYLIVDHLNDASLVLEDLSCWSSIPPTIKRLNPRSLWSFLDGSQ